MYVTVYAEFAYPTYAHCEVVKRNNLSSEVPVSLSPSPEMQQRTKELAQSVPPRRASNHSTGERLNRRTPKASFTRRLFPATVCRGTSKPIQCKGGRVKFNPPFLPPIEADAPSYLFCKVREEAEGKRPSEPISSRTSRGPVVWRGAALGRGGGRQKELERGGEVA